MKNLAIRYYFLLLAIFVANAGSTQELIDGSLLNSFSANALTEEVNNFIGSTYYQANYGVDIYKIIYTTDTVGSPDNIASGLLVIPQVQDSIMPVLCLQHGTSNSRYEVSSNLKGEYLLAVGFSGLGFITSTPDYIGLGDSPGFHPYLHADSEASAAIDMMIASRTLLDDLGINANDSVHITGYSQGGHAAMALHRELQANYSDQFPVAKASYMAGPYSISRAMKEAFLSDEPYYFPAYLANVFYSYRRVYNLFENISEYVKEPYADLMEMYYNEEIPLFIDSENDTSLNTLLMNQLNIDFNQSIPKYMLQDSILDAAINNPNHPINLAFADNNVYDWAPQSPARIVYCQGDDQIPHTNALLADSIMHSNGAIELEVIDVNPSADHNSCFLQAIVHTLGFFQPIRLVVGVDQIPEQNSSEQTEPKLYPNPASDHFILEEINTPVHLQIIDFDGQVSLEKHINGMREEIDISHLHPGIYVVKLIYRENMASKKLIVK